MKEKCLSESNLYPSNIFWIMAWFRCYFQTGIGILVGAELLLVYFSSEGTGELGYDRLNGTRKIGPSYAKSVVYIWQILDMHRTGTKHIVRHMRKSVVQWSVISKFTCIFFNGMVFYATRPRRFTNSRTTCGISNLSWLLVPRRYIRYKCNTVLCNEA